MTAGINEMHPHLYIVTSDWAEYITRIADNRNCTNEEVVLEALVEHHQSHYKEANKGQVTNNQ